MRKYLFILTLLSLTGLTKAQSPQKLSYQAVIRNSGNALVINSNIGMRVSLLQGSATGTMVYQEEYSPLPKSNGNGLVTLEIGTGTAITGTFSSIDWSLGNYFIKIETDPAGGSNYTVTGTHQLLSVPYALYSQTAAGLTATASIDPKQLSGSGAANGQVLKWNGASWSPANDNYTDGDTSPSNELQSLSIKNDSIFLTNGGAIELPKEIDGSITNEIQVLTKNNDTIYLSNGGGQIVLPKDTNYWTLDSDNLYNNSGQKIGIGTKSPKAALNVETKNLGGYYHAQFKHLDSTQPAQITTINSDESGQFVFGVNGKNHNSPKNGFIWLFNNNDIRFGTNGSEKMRLKNDGKLGIGTINPTEKLEVIGKIKSSDIQITNGAENNFVLSSDSFGNASWKSSSTTAWGLNGNGGTDSTHFIGTTDKQALLFKVHNSASGVIDSSTKNTALGFLTNPNKGTYNTAIGNYALKSSTKNYNTAIGSNALETNQNGEYNTALGSFALNSQTTGSYNTAVGTASMINSKNSSYNTSLGAYCLYYDSISSYNTAVGAFALTYNNKGNENAVLGNRAMYYNITGSRNVAAGATSLYRNTTGTDNVAIGNTSLLDNTTGKENTALGSRALYSNVGRTGSVAVGFNAMYYANNSSTTQFSGNTAVGYEALKGSNTPANNTGRQNTALGAYTIAANTTGMGNAAFGYNALSANTTGNFNVSIGSQNMSNNQSGEHNIALGYFGMYGNTSGQYNISAGSFSLLNNKSGNNNLAIGYYAMAGNVALNQGIAIGNNAMEYANSTTTSGTNTNIAIGYSALRGSSTASNNTGLNNTALGYFSNNKNTTGNSNTSIGAFTLSDNTTGGHNVALGLYALEFNTTGNYNVALGNYANRNNKSGENNTSIGYNANYSNVINHRSTAIGTSALYYADSRTSTAVSTYNTAVGYEAMRGSSNSANNTGFSNAAFGDQALYSFSSAHYNTAIGTASLINLTTGIGNTALGFETGKNATTGGANVFLGFQSGLNNSTGSGNVFLGYSAGANETGSDKLYIANTNTSTPLIFGNFSTKSVKVNDSFISKYLKLTNGALKNALLVSDSLGNASWTAVSTAISAGTGLSYSGNKLNSVWTVSGNNIYNNNSANVGIGLTGPTRKLVVADATTGFVAEIRNSNNSNSSLNHGLQIRAGSDVYNSSFVNNLITFNNPSASATFGGITQSSASGCSYATSSDIRLKENIKPTHFGLADLMKIEVKDYTFKLDNSKNPQTGFIAQQLYSVYPQPVVKGNDTTNWMVDYGQVTPLLVKSVQDQQKIIETQKLELISQKELILQLMQRLEKLEQKSNQ